MIDYTKIKGDSGKNYVTYNYKNKAIYCIRKNNGQLDYKSDSLKDKSLPV